MAAAKSAPRSRVISFSTLSEGAREATFVASTSNPVLAPDGVLEVLEPNWDLTAYLKHPVVLRDHDLGKPVGTAREIEPTADGLKVTVKFGTARTGVLAEETWNQVLEGLVRGMSVRWQGGVIRTEERDGAPVRVISKPELVEVSIVTVPLDEDAGMVERSPFAPEEEPTRPEGQARAASKSGEKQEPPEQDEEAMRRASVAAAARLLQSARKFAKRDARADDAGELVPHIDAARGRLGTAERTPLGGARIRVRMTRTGVLQYRNRDGSPRLECRTAEEIERSLPTLVGAPVTVGHPYELGLDGLMDAETFTKRAIGHVESAELDPHPDPVDGERWVNGVIVVQDAATLDAIDRGELEGVSVGYQSLGDKTPGAWRGKPYHLVQRGIVNNHLALLPPKGGRAGERAALRLDASDAVCVENEDQEAMTVKIIKLDGKEFDYGSENHLAHLDEKHRSEIKTLTDTHTTAIATKTKEVETLTAKCDSLESDNKKLAEQLTAATDSKAIEARVNARVSLLTNAGRILGAEAKLDGLTDREIMVQVIKLDQKDFEDKGADGKPRSMEYLEARYDNVVAKGVRTDSIDSVVSRAQQFAARLDSRIDENDPVVKARLEAQEPKSATT